MYFLAQMAFSSQVLQKNTSSGCEKSIMNFDLYWRAINGLLYFVIDIRVLIMSAEHLYVAKVKQVETHP